MSREQQTAAERILRLRIAFMLRRVTGIAYDIDAMLDHPRVRDQRLALWREAGSPELNELLDQLEREFHNDWESERLRAGPSAEVDG